MDEMEKPNLNRMWETFIKIGSAENILNAYHLGIIRSKIYPLIILLKNKEIIEWYSFLIHGRNSGVPTTEEDDNIYFHIRVSLKENIDSDNFLKTLPGYCVMTRKIDPQNVNLISGIDKTKLKIKK